MKRSATKLRRARTRIPKCNRCEERPAEHVVLIQGVDEAKGYPLYSCVECWPGLRAAIETVRMEARWCDCGECL